MHEGKERPKFKCTLCDESFSTKKTLEGHMSVHEGKIFQCSNCDDEFKSKIKLEVHIAKEHDRSKLHQCTQCDTAYVKKQSLLTHIAFVHEKTIRCGIFGFCLFLFPQNERKMYKLRPLSPTSPG